MVGLAFNTHQNHLGDLKTMRRPGPIFRYSDSVAVGWDPATYKMLKVTQVILKPR